MIPFIALRSPAASRHTRHSSGSCESRPVRVAKAIAEGKMKVTMADLDRLIRLEEFLREEDKKAEGLRVILDWSDGEGKETEGQEDADQ